VEAAGGVAYWQGDMDAARVFYDENLELARATGDPRTIADALYNVSFPLIVGRLAIEASRPLLEEAVGIYRTLGDDAAVGRCLWAIGNIAWFEGQPELAIPPLDEAIELFRKTGDRFSYAWGLHTRALAAIDLKDAATAKPLAEEAMQLFLEVEDVSGMVLVLNDFAELALVEGDRERAAKLAGAELAHEAQIGSGIGSLTKVRGTRGLIGLDTEADQRAMAEGRRWSLEQAVAYALGHDLHREAASV
jgi:tetratricopeptide (TPR) repeat protein